MPVLLYSSGELKFMFGTYMFIYLNDFDCNVSNLQELEPA